MKRRKIFGEKLIAIALVCFVVISGICFVPSCSADTANNSAILKNVEWIENTPTSCDLKWDEIEGAQYNIYKAESRFAQYEKIATINTNEYTDNSYNGSYYKITAVIDGKESAPAYTSYEMDLFGENTYIFEDTDNQSEMQNVIDEKYKILEAGQFSKERCAFLFKPSAKTYDVTGKVGFYTQYAGLGLSPEDTTISGIQCMARWMIGKKYDGSVNNNALCNFWRSVENFSSPATDTIWAVSQATAMRRMNYTGSIKDVYYWDGHKSVFSHTDPKYGTLYLHDQGGYASGGFLADTKISTNVSSGSQQQWISRNIESGVNPYNETSTSYDPAVWNNVLVGSKTTITQSNWPKGTSTVVDKTPVVAEKPFLTYDDAKNEYGICVPKVKENTSGVSWEDMKPEDYTYISLDDCYIAKPDETATKINAGIVGKKALILTPGIYETDQPIEINNADTIVLGLGYATIKPTKGNQCMQVADVKGVRIAGVLFDAGQTKSETLLTVGETKNDADNSDNPVVLSDCFFRVGGADSTPCKTKSCVVINSNNVICDNFWVWRADHGFGVGWDKNTADNGVIFNGDNITAYGLMVEHFQKVQTLWNGDGGRCYMYQSELPYDITSQSAWNEEGSYGYTDYKVASNVKSHEGYGIGIYSCYQAAQCYLKSAVTCPDTENVRFTNVCTYSLVGNGTIDFPINNAGYAVMKSFEMCRILSYSNGTYTSDKTGDAAKKSIWSATIDIAGKSVYDDTFKVVYTGKELKPRVKVTYEGIALRDGVDYFVTYKNNKQLGATAKITIAGKGYFNESESYKFKIIPAKVQISSKKITKKKINLKWKKVAGVKKYEVKYSTKKNFSKNKTTTKIIKKNKISIKRKQKGIYYVKIRAFAKVNGKKLYGRYSKVLKAK